VAIKLIAPFNKKLKLFVVGRKGVFKKLKASIHPNDKTIWMHVSSLGEYEQGLPILEYLQQHHKSYKIVLTFFSPSGYEVKKNTSVAHVVTYLPLDTKSNAKKFIALVKPTIAVFVKYEIWPNYLHYLKNNEVPTFLVSAIFNEKQIYFKSFGSFMRNALDSFSHFFVQNPKSKELLETIGFDKTTISGDTRFDRVEKILRNNNSVEFIRRFKGASVCVVAGSTWPEDEAVLVDYINTSNQKTKWVIAPHNIKSKDIERLRSSILKKSIVYSERANHNIQDADVFIVDTIGLLTKIYSYADIAYVGGGFATGLHNTLEPAVFGVPIVIGPQYHGFKEAEDLVELGGLLTITNSREFNDIIQELVNQSAKRKTVGEINATYITNNLGATQTITEHLQPFL
jgi:3-deoxy-D-manno-octulosonic-acid transferase